MPASTSGCAAQSVFDGDYDEIEPRQEEAGKRTRCMNGMKVTSAETARYRRGQAAADEWDER